MYHFYRNEDSDFDRLQEDLVLKLMGDEETPKPVPNSFEVSGVPPPPNLIPQVPIQDRWFYQDPQVTIFHYKKIQ